MGKALQVLVILIWLRVKNKPFRYERVFAVLGQEVGKGHTKSLLVI